MCMKNYIAIDLGATSGRVILACVDSSKRVSMETLHRFVTPLKRDGEKFFWDINNIYENIIEGLKIAAKRNVQIESIGIDTWGVDFVVVKKDGSFRSLPRSYRDPYTFKAQESFFERMPREELYSRTGIQIMNFNSVFQLYAQRQSGDIHDDDTILFMPDALSYMLTGNKVCEYTILSTAAIMDPRSHSLDEKILDVCKIRKDMFPALVYPGHIIGTLKEEVLQATGLSLTCVKAVAGHDTGSVVAAIPAKNEHFAYLSSGTWSLMGIETPKPIVSEMTYASNFTNEGGATGTIRFLKNITGMWIMEQCLEKLREEGKDYTYPEIVDMARSAEPSQHLINPDDVCFASPQDMPQTINTYLESRRYTAPKSDAELFRLIYDSLANRYAEVFNILQELAPYKIETLNIVGGGSQNELLNQMTAKSCKVKVIAGPTEGTALGNIMLQAGITREEICKSITTKIYEGN